MQSSPVKVYIYISGSHIGDVSKLNCSHKFRHHGLAESCPQKSQSCLCFLYYCNKVPSLFILQFSFELKTRLGTGIMAQWKSVWMTWVQSPAPKNLNVIKIAIPSQVVMLLHHSSLLGCFISPKVHHKVVFYQPRWQIEQGFVCSRKICRLSPILEYPRAMRKDQGRRRNVSIINKPFMVFTFMNLRVIPYMGNFYIFRSTLHLFYTGICLAYVLVSYFQCSWQSFIIMGSTFLF